MSAIYPRIMPRYFYPRPPCGGRPAPDAVRLLRCNDFYPRPPCGGPAMISIHALRAEGDRWGIEVEHVCAIFLSTPSVRRATRGGCSIAQVLFYFYPRPPCGGRLYTSPDQPSAALFLSTPSVRRATSAATGKRARARSYFYPRPPCGGRPLPDRRGCPGFRISIHALRAEGDMSRSALSPRATYFYPRPPCGGRQLLVCTTINQRLFLSTPSVRRATGAGAGAAHVVADFYPRPPCGGRRHKSAGTVGHIWISIHALRADPRPPCGGRPHGVARLEKAGSISIHALRAEGDTVAE